MTTQPFTPEQEWQFACAQLAEAKKRRINMDLSGYFKRVRETNLAALRAEIEKEQASGRISQ
ncbi:MAG TPA: hypothetical protein DD397_06850 [Hyphomonas sp.]|jgi:hypothetical protein|uniref:hypothetical protein n=1 Tax=Hyphomonas sp. TaxID=87 RepID=UPI000E8ADDD2|nr:hypothetical protein [Hyphomonas sp.]QDP49064.1 MAG: hypothetical protein Unbinned4811contig1001_9 [Prokaryotic dsDNA virus sp.]HBN92264.1 hypothetical protein [Hyphomonas sp.]|tara:strand:+ start:4513 stop:4698 length:186 start_codon:yes stop_codon:yes gene_type:complete